MDDNHQAPIELVPVNWRNILTVWRLAKNIFGKRALELSVYYTASLTPQWLWPKDNREAIAGVKDYIAMKDHIPVGITGLYTFRDQPKEAWLDWYGLDEKLRGRGVGKAILQATIDMARKNGYETLRLWTTENRPESAIANKLFQKLAFTSQKTDHTYSGYPVLIYSFALNGGQPSLYQGNVRRCLAVEDHSNKVGPRPV